MLSKLFIRLTAAAAVLTLAACTTVDKPTEDKPAVSFRQTDFDRLPSADGESWQSALAAFRRSCTVLQNDSRWRDVCLAALETDALGAQRFFLSRFVPWQILARNSEGDLSDTGLMTGYYEPLLKGSLTRKPPFVHPVYGVPDDLLVVDLAELYPKLKGMRLRGKLVGRRIVPYDSRAEIDRRDDMSRWALAWVDDPVAAFFLQIQGSGRILLEDGSYLRIGYADQNGHPYRAIGGWLVSRGYLKRHELSMQRIQAWARSNPSRVGELLEQNPSFVFFEERAGSPDEGPLGAQGVPLTPEASVAVDPRFWRMGTPFIVTADQNRPDLHFVRPVIAQDTGGAIRGAVRFDYFWGFGDRAGEAAGRQKSEARAWVLIPTGLTPDDIRAR
ncbi:MAG: MltA domain-containing protein [Sutterella sp.]|nr:MltA domain-containing protein [Sutterella sp.]